MPSDNTAKSLMPKSKPTDLPVLGKGLVVSDNSTATDTNHLVPFLKTVAFKIFPLKSKFSLSFTQPKLGIFIFLPINLNWSLVKLNLSLMPFFLNCGYLACPLKKLSKALPS